MQPGLSEQGKTIEAKLLHGVHPEAIEIHILRDIDKLAHVEGVDPWGICHMEIGYPRQTSLALMLVKLATRDSS
jgi:hypothetical protein